MDPIEIILGKQFMEGLPKEKDRERIKRAKKLLKASMLKNNTLKRIIPDQTFDPSSKETVDLMNQLVHPIKILCLENDKMKETQETLAGPMRNMALSSVRDPLGKRAHTERLPSSSIPAVNIQYENPPLEPSSFDDPSTRKREFHLRMLANRRSLANGCFVKGGDEILEIATWDDTFMMDPLEKLFGKEFVQALPHEKDRSGIERVMQSLALTMENNSKLEDVVNNLADPGEHASAILTLTRPVEAKWREKLDAKKIREAERQRERGIKPSSSEAPFFKWIRRIISAMSSEYDFEGVDNNQFAEDKWADLVEESMHEKPEKEKWDPEKTFERKIHEWIADLEKDLGGSFGTPIPNFIIDDKTAPSKDDIEQLMNLDKERFDRSVAKILKYMKEFDGKVLPPWTHWECEMFDEDLEHFADLRSRRRFAHNYIIWKLNQQPLNTQETWDLLKSMQFFDLTRCIKVAKSLEHCYSAFSKICVSVTIPNEPNFKHLENPLVKFVGSWKCDAVLKLVGTVWKTFPHGGNNTIFDDGTYTPAKAYITMNDERTMINMENVYCAPRAFNNSVGLCHSNRRNNEVVFLEKYAIVFTRRSELANGLFVAKEFGDPMELATWEDTLLITSYSHTGKATQKFRYNRI